jgi:deoxycytidylate deaminase
MRDMGDIPNVGDRELVVAIVTPLGAPVELTLVALRDAFARNGYAVEDMRISVLLDKAVASPATDEKVNRIRRLMDKGDEFRRMVGSDEACAYMAAQAIPIARFAKTGSPLKHRAKHVNLVRSLKTPGEVRVLRQIYGQRLIVVGVAGSKEERRKELTKQLKSELPKHQVAAEVSMLLERDEKDEQKALGQRGSDAYRLSDAFVAVTTRHDSQVVDRLVDLLLGEPYHTPTRDEQGMFHAWSVKFRSSAAGRQVGAAIVDADGEVVALGCNDVPRPGGGQYWPGDPDDRRDFQLGHDANDRGKFGAAENLLSVLAEAGWLVENRKALPARERAVQALERGGPLDRSELADLIEFGRIVHAEMAALMTAARRGRAVRGCTLYTTTYPCHECARLIIAAGITRVCFVDPYPKSRAPELFDGMLDETHQTGRVLIEPFVGVSPRLFSHLFEMSNRSKDVYGEYAKWERKQLVVEDEEIADSIPLQEKAAGAYLAAVLRAWSQGQDQDKGQND